MEIIRKYYIVNALMAFRYIRDGSLRSQIFHIYILGIAKLEITLYFSSFYANWKQVLRNMLHASEYLPLYEQNLISSFVLLIKSCKQHDLFFFLRFRIEIKQSFYDIMYWFTFCISSQHWNSYQCTECPLINLSCDELYH